VTKREEGSNLVYIIVFIEILPWLDEKFSCVFATEGRTCGAWQIREPGYTCS